MMSKVWFFTFLWCSIFFIAGSGLLNYIVDPFSVTGKNLLGIPLKIVSDDRTEKVVAINNMNRIDVVLLGSSRVYLMNPLVLNKYLDGVTYNLGVGTAQAEDHLGFLKHLEKINKFPKTIILGLDFYSFNDNLETNKYFIRNETINFLNENTSDLQDIEQFFSLDTTRASIKTLKSFLGVKKSNRRFDEHGTSGDASTVFEYFPSDDDGVDIYARDIQREASNFLNQPPYTSLSDRRFGYLRSVVELAERHGATLKVFITPLYGRLLDDIHADELLSKRLLEFKQELLSITDYYDFLMPNTVTADASYFNDTSHLKTSTANLIFARMFDDAEVDVPEDFGVYRQR